MGMTREVALRKVRGYLTDYFSITDYNEVEEIMLALEQQPCEDAISREKAIGIVARIKEMHIDDREQYQINYGTICDIDLALQQLPSVTPTSDAFDKIINKIEQTRDKDKIAEYPYNRCIRIIEEYKGGN